MDIVVNWEQIVSWLVLIFILFAFISSKIRYEAVAFGGLLFLGLLRISKPVELFSGFSNPALFTVIIVLVMSEGIVESGLFLGLGKSIAKKIHDPEKQILVVSFSAWFMSFFVNNVGVIGLILPTAQRMAKRAGINKANFGLYILYAIFLGGSVTLISTASNLIVSSFRFQAFGQPFKMFDFAAHGLAMSAMSLLLWFLCRLCGHSPLRQQKENILNPIPDRVESFISEPARKISLRNTVIILASLLLAIVLASIGLVHPSITFGFVVLLWITTDIFSLKTAYSAINISILLFLGSMLSISEILNRTGALPDLIEFILPLVILIPAFPLILVFLFITAILSNIVDNSVSALLMSPAAILLFQSGTVNVTADALLMAVAAGASLGLVLPTDPATIVAMNSMGFQKKDFIKKGIIIALSAGIVASIVIYFLWN